MKRRHLILLVDDNQDDVSLTLRAFERSAFPNELIVVKDGEEALDYLFATGPYSDRNPEVMPEVVLLDLNLPKVNGIEVLRRLRAHPRTRRLPVVILTSSTERNDVVSAYDLGANSFIRKPVDFDEFLATSQQLGLYWLRLNEPPPSVSPEGASQP